MTGRAVMRLLVLKSIIVAFTNFSLLGLAFFTELLLLSKSVWNIFKTNSRLLIYLDFTEPAFNDFEYCVKSKFEASNKFSNINCKYCFIVVNVFIRYKNIEHYSPICEVNINILTKNLAKYFVAGIHL